MNLTPRTWTKCNDKEAKALFDEVLKEAENLGYRPHVLPDLMVFDATSYYGMCRSKKYGKYYRSSIGINKKILMSRAILTEVLVHEIAHSVAPGEKHGPRWKKIGNTIGKRFGVTVERIKPQEFYKEEGVSIEEDEPEIKYIVECPCCHQRWEYARASKTAKHPELYRCGECKTELVRIK